MSFKRKYSLSVSLFCPASRGTFIQLMCDFTILSVVLNVVCSLNVYFLEEKIIHLFFL